MRLRKLAAAVLGFSMIFAAPAYANDADAVAVYQEMQEKQKTVNDMNAYYDYQIVTEAGGAAMSMRMEMNAKANQMQDPDQIRMYTYSRITMNALEAQGNGPGEQEEIHMDFQPITYSTYYADGMYYMDMLGQKVKQPMPLAEVMKQTQSVAGTADLNLEYMRDMKLRYEGENRVVSYTIDVNGLNGMVEQVLGSMAGMPGMTGQSVNVHYQELSGECIVNPDGYCIKTRTNVSLEAEANGETAKRTLSGDVAFTDLGQAVELPAINPAEYQLEEPLQ